MVGVFFMLLSFFSRELTQGPHRKLQHKRRDFRWFGELVSDNGCYFEQIFALSNDAHVYI